MGTKKMGVGVRSWQKENGTRCLRRLSEVRNWRRRTELSRDGRRVRPKDSGCSGDTWTRYIGTYLRLCAISPLACCESWQANTLARNREKCLVDFG